MTTNFITTNSRKVGEGFVTSLPFIALIGFVYIGLTGLALLFGSVAVIVGAAIGLVGFVFWTVGDFRAEMRELATQRDEARLAIEKRMAEYTTEWSR